MTQTIPTEKQEQCWFVKWLKNHPIYKNIPFFHIANEGIRDSKTRQILFYMGFRSGVPDLFLPLIRSNYGGLFIEMKRRDEKCLPTAEQLYVCNKLIACGYHVDICLGWNHASEVAQKYCDLKPGEKL